jgi:RecA/RadA recombinase
MARRGEKTDTLEFTVAALNARYGDSVLRDAGELLATIPPRIMTGFAPIDALTGCGGIPQGHISLFTGRTTSGKLSVAYRVLAGAQGAGRHKDPVAILDLTGASDPQTLEAAGIRLDDVLFVRPPKPEQAVTLLYDVLRMQPWRCLLIDGLADLLISASIARGFDAVMPELARLVRQQRTALLLLDEPAPPWLRFVRVGSGALVHYAALHLEFARKDWRRQARGGIDGYTTLVKLERSRWARPGKSCEAMLGIDH